MSCLLPELSLCYAHIHALISSADAVIVNYNLGIKDMFQEYGSDKDILFSKDYGGDSIVNAGESTHIHSHCIKLRLFMKPA